MSGSGSGAGFFDSLIGLRLGGYVVRRMIARGGMGVVFEGHQESLDRKVAIKILYPHLSDDTSFRERFQHEARSAAQLRHPHIVRVIDFGVDSGYLYMVMELVEGHSLRDELVRARESGQHLSIARSVEILSAVGSALAYAHSLGLVHRDVKPGNILIDEAGHIFLTDFGLVKLAGVGGMTATGAVIGTPEYMAPEQYISTTDAGPAADQYALAVVAYEMLAGHAPFQAPTPVGLMQKHLNEMPQPVRAMDPDVSPEVDSIIMKALSKEPEQRYPSISDFVQDLASSTAPTRQLNAPALPSDATPTVMDLPRVPDATVLDPPSRRDGRVAGATIPDGVVAAGAGAAGAGIVGGGVDSAADAPLSGPVSGVGGGGAPPPSPARAVPDRSGRPSWFPFVIGGGVLAAIIALGFLLLGGDDSGGDGVDPTATTQAGVVNAPGTTTPFATNTVAAVDPTETVATGGATEQVAVVETPTTPPVVQPTNTAEPVASETVVNVPPTPTTGAGQPTPTRPPIVERPIINAPTPTPGQISVPTPASGDEAFAEAITSTFDTDADIAEWPIAQDRSDFAITMVDGYYVVDVLENDPNGYSLYSFPSSASNITQGVVGATLLIEGQGFAGVMARGTGGETGIDSMYECQYSNAGEFSCFKQVAGEWTQIVPLQFTDAIVPDGFNTIIYAVIGTEHALVINDVEVATWTDDSLAGPGAWGVFVERSPGATSMRASYDTVIVLEEQQ